MKVEGINGTIFITKSVIDNKIILHGWTKNKENLTMNQDELKENIMMLEKILEDKNVTIVTALSIKLNRIQLIMLIRELRKYLKEE